MYSLGYWSKLQNFMQLSANYVQLQTYRLLGIWKPAEPKPDSLLYPTLMLVGVMTAIFCCVAIYIKNEKFARKYTPPAGFRGEGGPADAANIQ